MVIAQHSDVVLGYDDPANPTGFVIEQDCETDEGHQLFESEFEELGGDFTSDEPGFITEPGELQLGAGDKLYLRALDARNHSSYGVGFVNFFNPNTGNLDVTGGDVLISDDIAGLSNPERNSSTDLTLSGTSSSGSALQFIDMADSNGFLHQHVFLDLLNDASAPNGAYGILFQLESDTNADGTTDIFSDEFWIVWNHGLDEETFESSLSTFGKFSAVPEPGALSFMLMVGCAGILRRRRA